MTDAEDPNPGDTSPQQPVPDEPAGGGADEPTQSNPVAPEPSDPGPPTAAYGATPPPVAPGPAVAPAGDEPPPPSTWKSPIGIAVIILFLLVLAGGIALFLISRD